ncbi:uncharacterized protein TRUGW13939_05243 [Talaromyces rugulosus]|uniref:ORC6 first cyclin-like domain-containing protein n=1 Tax=Talaromyces rugulosus TaxID=121627 RepID=A0A7H8QVN2_TALRU|nr:uncharacterized protein TRUGW13939_05243 [Talaromyces rugulosus]QKX58122.1 hypothetical protein TRUGW13939_05243 [Talaromyces rugulosus]
MTGLRQIYVNGDYSSSGGGELRCHRLPPQRSVCIWFSPAPAALRPSASGFSQYNPLWEFSSPIIQLQQLNSSTLHFVEDTKMNNRPVEQVLATLLPTHANEIPPELLSLAQSLIAQSRSYTSSLKPEEEIARPFACAEIACRRLARALKLPPLLGHPPCPPRVYKKLYTFLDNSIGGSSKAAGKAGSRTPSRAATTPRKETAATPSNTASARTLQNNTPSKSTPRRSNLLNDRANGTPSKTASVKRARFKEDPLQTSYIIKDAADWVMPSVRTVCKTLSTPAPRMSLLSRPPVSRTLPPHMFTGVSSILHFFSSMTDDAFGKLDEEASDFLEILRTPGEEKTDDYKEIVMALVVAVYFLVLARRRSPGPVTENTNAESTPTPDESQKMDKKTFSEMRQTALSSLGLSPTDKRHGEDVDAWIALIMDQNWAKGQEWFDNIPSVGQRSDDFLDENGHGLEDDDPMEASTPKRRRTKLFAQAGSNKEGALLPGLGTMMQDRVDYLSEDRREDYLEWKADMMKRIASMDKSAGAIGRKASVKKQAVAA